jgi:hypothetical protein
LAWKKIDIGRTKMADLWLVVGGPAVEFPANIFEPGKISEKILCSLSRKQQQKTRGDKRTTD